MRSFMRVVAAVATFLWMATVVAYIIDIPTSIVAPSLVSAMIANSILLLYGLVRLSMIGNGEFREIKIFGSAHVIAHVIPFGYLLAWYFKLGNQWLDLAFLLPFAIFFYTGKRMWRVLYDKFDNIIYRLYVFGNSGMLSAIFVTTILDLTVRREMDFSLFQKLLLFYLSIHFLLVGASVLQVSRDVERE